MKFSFVVPVYNVEAYLPRCIESLMHQTYSDIEIILVDDGSPDNCPKICDDYAARDTRIKVIHQKNKGNGGASAARNKGLQTAAGDYVWFVDSDDYIEPDACEKFARYTEEGYDILLGDALFEEDGGSNSFLYTTGVTSKVIDGPTFLKILWGERRYINAVWLGPYRRKFLLENRLAFQQGLSLEDFEFFPRAFLKAQTVVCTRIPFYHYVKRKNSQVTKKNQRKNDRDILCVCRRHEARFRNLQDEELKQVLMGRYLREALVRIYMSRIYQYQVYIDKGFFKRTAYTRSEKLLCSLLCISPRLFCCVMELNSRFKIRKTIISFLKYIQTIKKTEHILNADEIYS